MGIARNTQQLMLLKGERIYHSMTDAKSVIKDHKAKLRTYAKCFSGRYNTIACVSVYVCYIHTYVRMYVITMYHSVL